MAKAALYIRVSTVMQLDKESRTVQKNDLVQYCENVLGIGDYEMFEDAGFSAASTDRPDYQNMMRRIRAGGFTHLLVWKIDRISRNILDFTEMYQELQRINIAFVSLAEQFDTSSLAGQALLKMILIFAELERHNATERSKAVLLSKAGAGEYTGARTPFGYHRNSETNEYTIEENEAALVRQIFNMFEQGITVYAIVKHLNELPLNMRIKEKWQMPALGQILDNMFYTGDLRYNYRSYISKNKRIINAEKDWVLVENNHPSIISKKQFEKCQKLLAERRQTNYQIRKPLFSDVLICDTDHLPLSWKKEDNRKFSSPATYWCSHCTQINFTDADIGDFVLNYILNLLQAQESLSPSTSLSALKRMLLRGDISRTVNDISNLDDIKRSLLSCRNASALDMQYAQRKLRFELKQKERQMEWLTSTGTVLCSSVEAQAIALKVSIDELYTKLNQFESDTDSTPHTGYLKKCHDFYFQYNLYHRSSIDLSYCKKNILFYDLKHFLQDAIAGIYVRNRRIVSIAFRADKDALVTHLFA